MVYYPNSPIDQKFRRDAVMYDFIGSFIRPRFRSEPLAEVKPTKPAKLSQRRAAQASRRANR